MGSFNHDIIVMSKQAAEMKRILIWMAQYDGNPNDLQTQAQRTLIKIAIMEEDDG